MSRASNVILLRRAVRRAFRKVFRRAVRKDCRKVLSWRLKLKFGEAGLALLPEIREIRDVAVLEAILKRLETSDDLGDLRQVYH